jgi:hypothetical protein
MIFYPKGKEFQVPIRQEAEQSRASMDAMGKGKIFCPYK